MYQKDANGERTVFEMGSFKRSLIGMNLSYASLTRTAVVQLKDIPQRPAEYDGRLIVYTPPSGGEDSDEREAAARADLSRFGGELVELVTDCTEWAHACFASHEQAERCISALREEGRGAATVYNETKYDRERGEPYSGWCVHPHRTLSPPRARCLCTRAGICLCCRC